MILDGNIDLTQIWAHSDHSYTDLKRLLVENGIAESHAPAYALYTQIASLDQAQIDPLSQLHPTLQDRLSTQPERTHRP